MSFLIIGDTNNHLQQEIKRIQNEWGSEVIEIDKPADVYAELEERPPHLIIFAGVDNEVLTLVKKLRQDKLTTAVTIAVTDKNGLISFSDLEASCLDDIIELPSTDAAFDNKLLRRRLWFVTQRAKQRKERYRIEGALKTSRKNALVVLNTTVDGIITIDASCIIQSYNRAAKEIFGYTEEEVIGKNISILMPSPHREEHDAYVNSYHETNHRKIIGIGREVRGLRKNGEIFPMELAVSEINHDNQRSYTGIIRDISVRRELEVELLRTSEEERRRIGHDIHDGLGQMLTGIGLIAKNLAQNMRSNDYEEADQVFELVDLIKSADEQARAISRTLVPVELEGGGLKAAVFRLNNNIERLYGLQCTYEESGNLPVIPANVNTHFFRIIQEAMGNAAKHSKASRISVAVAGNEDQVRVRIKDNGVGIDLEHTNGQGMGLRIMQHRANVIGASLKVSNGSSNGTIVTCTLLVNK